MPPRKPRSKKPKKLSNTPPPEVNKAPAVPPVSLEKVNNQQDNFNPVAITDEKKKEQVTQDLHLCKARVKEFLSSFLVIGYTLEEGYPIQIISAENQKDLDALNLAFQRFIYQNATVAPVKPGPAPEDPHHEPS